MFDGGGVRVKKITDYDGISTGNDIMRNYSYAFYFTGHIRTKLIKDIFEKLSENIK